MNNEDEEEEEEEENSDEDEKNQDRESPDGKQKNHLQQTEKRISRRKWERRKQEILIEYESFSYSATSSAVVLFDLAWKLSQDNHQLLWLEFTFCNAKWVMTLISIHILNLPNPE